MNIVISNKEYTQALAYFHHLLNERDFDEECFMLGGCLYRYEHQFMESVTLNWSDVLYLKKKSKLFEKLPKQIGRIWQEQACI